ncbi:hypothetical protein GGX14DRAFT_672374 [Mycena pura]|uniref:Uncharacterized protein n=1 Tax=Mycena pura TaxID=153505 RepID=A0AAD6UWH4_9AGAR|nr:hypothetical protein GGX14DRAFT_672374 [Mycena pura]
MRAILLLAVFMRLPSTSTTPGKFTITYQSETSDPAGKMTFWYGHTDGAGGYLIAAENVAHTKSPTPLQVDIPVTAADGLQWQFAAGPVQNFIVVVRNVDRQWHHREVYLSKSLDFSFLQIPFSRVRSHGKYPREPDAFVFHRGQLRVQRKSSPSVGHIVGLTFAATTVLALALGLLLFRVRRQHRARRRVKDIEPAWVSAPDSGTGSAFDSAAEIEPYTATPGPAAPSAAMAGPGAMAASGSKAAAERQAYLTNQLAAVQAQLAALALAGGNDDGGTLAPSTTPGVVDSPNPATDEPGALREQNAALHARIGVLEEQLRSQWAQGLSDEPPPGYHDLE